MIYAGVATLLAGGGYYYYNQGDNASKVKSAAKDAEAKAKGIVAGGKAKVESSGKPAFTGGDQGFFGLRLESVENVNHNTKKFRFALPEEDQVSGLHIASAILTKYKGPEMEKPAIRPYTPVSGECKSIISSLQDNC